MDELADGDDASSRVSVETGDRFSGQVLAGIETPSRFSAPSASTAMAAVTADEVATVTVETDGKSAEEVADEVAAAAVRLDRLAGIEPEVIPGVSSALYAPLAAGIVDVNSAPDVYLWDRDATAAALYYLPHSTLAGAILFRESKPARALQPILVV